MKAILIEDRPDRQRIYLPNNENDVEQLASIEQLYLPKSQECKEIISQINRDENIMFTEAKLIMIHKSALTTKGINKLNNYARNNNCKIIYFSGGNDQLIYNDDGFESLHINSKDFYSHRLIPFIQDFIENKNPHLLELNSKDWKLSYMFLMRQLIENYKTEEDNEEKTYLTTRIDEIKKIIVLDKEENLSKEINKIIVNL